MLASVKPRVNVSGARGAGGGRSSGGDPASRGRSRDSPSTWPAAEGGRAAARSPSRGRLPWGCERTLQRLELVHPSPRSGRGDRRRERWSPERARQPDARAGGAAGGRGAAPRALVADRREGAYCRDPAQPALGLRSSASLRRLCNAGRRASGEPELTVVGAGDPPDLRRGACRWLSTWVVAKAPPARPPPQGGDSQPACVREPPEGARPGAPGGGPPWDPAPPQRRLAGSARDVVLRAGAAAVAPWPCIPCAPRAGLLRCFAFPGGIQVGSGAEDRAVPEQSLCCRQSDVPAEPAPSESPARLGPRPAGEPTKPTSLCPAPPAGCLDARTGGLAVPSRLSRDRSDFWRGPLLSPVYMQSVRPGSLPGVGAERELAFLLRSPGFLSHGLGRGSLDGEALAWAFSASPGRVTPGALGTHGPRWR